jgi:hypothetical protein
LDPHPSILWTLHREGKIASCEVRFVPNGVDVRVLRNGTLLLSQVFPSGDEALAFAEAERERTLRSGWGWVVKG